MIPVNASLISKNARKYVLDCLNSGWVSSQGKYLEAFEKGFAKFIGVKYASSCSSGTAALHLALAALGVGQSDEVIMPDLTIISCALAVIYLGAKPVLVDVEKDTGNIDPEKIEEKITKRTKAILVVHLYGHPADMEPILKIAKKYKLAVIEDAAEAHGAEVRSMNHESRIKGKKHIWRKVGNVGGIGCFSFYANKIVTTGEGGMVVTNNKSLYEKVESLKNLAHSKRRFVHEEIGFNYRMTNMQAALGLAQLEEVEKYLQIKQWMASEYQKLLSQIPYLELPVEKEYARSVFWMYAVKMKDERLKIQDLMEQLKKSGIDTREFFYPLHKQPVLLKMGLFKNEKYPVSEDLSNRGFYLPSGLAITKEQIKTVYLSLADLFN